MMVILHRYIFRELLRAFVMTAVALTFMLGFGGGLLDMIKSHGISAAETVKLLVYLMPVVLTYSLPVAALFSTTITYGRLAADNEFDACRVSGINVHRLLLPAVGLSLLVSVTTFGLENFAIPELAKRIEQLLKRDSQSIAFHGLKQRGYMAHMGFALHCGQVGTMILPQERPDGSLSPGQIPLSKVAFLQRERGMPVFYGTAKTALIEFDHRPEGLVVSVYLNQVRAFNEQRGEMSQAGFLTIGPLKVPSFSRQRIKFLSLPELYRTIDDPMRFKGFRDVMASVRKLLRQSLVYEDIARQLDSEGQCRLEDRRHEYVITANKYQRGRSDGRIILQGNVRITQRATSGSDRKFLAKRAMISASDRGHDVPPAVKITLKTVRVSDPSDVDPNNFVSRPAFTLSGLRGRKRILAEARRYTIDRLLDPDQPLNFGERIENQRFEAAQARTYAVGRSIAELHSRFAYSSSALILLVLGATLGIIFRGGHFVSAFGLSFIPMMIVVVLIMTGKQICGAGFAHVGVPVIWSGWVIVGLVNIVILAKFLRR